MAALPDPCAHGLEQSAALGAAGWAAGAAGGDIAADGPVDKASQIGLRAEPGIGGYLIWHLAGVGGGGIEQREQAILVGGAIGYTLEKGYSLWS